MKVYVLKREQRIKAEIDEIWDFFASAKNLAAITPAYMDFRITSTDVLDEIYEGEIITYKIAPVLGISLSWMTEITHVVKYERFVDEQKSGPYSIWHHKHYFKETDNGIIMTDIVHYALPLGFLGKIAHALFVKKQLQNIFEYRRLKIDELFNKKS